MSSISYSQGKVGLVRSHEASKRARSIPVLCDIVRVVDAAVILATGAAAFGMWLFDTPTEFWPQYGALTVFGALLAFNLLQVRGAYRFEILADLGDSLMRTLTAWVGVGAIIVAALFLTKTSEEFSRMWSLLWFALAGVGLAASRFQVRTLIGRWTSEGRLNRNVVVVGAGRLGRRFMMHVARVNPPGVRVLGVFDDRRSRVPSECSGFALLGNLDELEAYVRRNAVDTVVVAVSWRAEDRLLEMFERLKALPVDVRLCPDLVGFHLSSFDVSHMGQLTLLNVANRPLSDWRLVAKNMEDRILAPLILLLVSPVMLVIAMLIKLQSPGPVFFRQKRYGFNNQLIEVLKFRTMRHDACDANAEQLTRRNDPRVTRLGAFLRRTSLDELPQFINVVRGEMSIVGPRPHALRAKAGGVLYDEAVKRYAARHRVKPGITGWAQVNGWRGETETVEQIQKRVEHDLAYIESWSLALDIKIIARTILTGFTGRNAY